MKLTLLFGLLLVAGIPISLAQADTLITTREGSRMLGNAEDLPESMRNNSGGDEATAQLWSRADKMARIGAGSRIIGRPDRGETYMINDAARTCMVIKHSVDKVDKAAATGPEFKKTGETRQVGPWRAVGYELAGSMNDGGDDYEVSIWVSDEVTLGLDDYRSYTEGVATPDMAWMIKSLELGGYPVRQEIRIGQMATWTEIVSVEDKPPPPGIYDIPDGYSGCDQ